MGMIKRTAAAAAIAALCVAPATSFGQTAPAAPPAGQAAPDAGAGGQGAPGGQPPVRILPLPPEVLPRGGSGPGMGGGDCEHERSPATGV
jgi:hypothetical protein